MQQLTTSLSTSVSKNFRRGMPFQAEQPSTIRLLHIPPRAHTGRNVCFYLCNNPLHIISHMFKNSKMLILSLSGIEWLQKETFNTMSCKFLPPLCSLTQSSKLAIFEKKKRDKQKRDEHEFLYWS